MRRFEYGAGLVLMMAMAGCAQRKDAPGPDSMVASRQSPAEASGPAAPGAPAGRAVLFLGTSLTAGLGLDADSAYPQRVGRLIAAKGLPFHAVNAGVSGETSAGLLRRLEWVLKDSAALIVVETGANDGLRGQPVEGTKATIGTILDRIHAAQPAARVVLVQMEAPPNLGVDYTRAFHGMFPALARAHGVTLMPFLLDSVAGFPGLNQGDGIHPNDRGERIVTRTVWRTIGPILDTLAGGAGIAGARRGG